MRFNSKAVACFGFALMALGFATPSSAQQGIATPTVSGAWVKTTVPGGNVSAAYMQIKSATPLKLVKAETTFAGIVEIHDMKMNDGVMQMKALDSLDVPAGTMVELKPGGTHVMLMDVKKPIVKGDKVRLVLTFEGAAKKQVVVKLDAIARENHAGGRK